MLQRPERLRLVGRHRDPLQGVGGHVGAGLVAEVLEDPQGVLVRPALLAPALRLLARRVRAGAAAAAVPLQLRQQVYHDVHRACDQEHHEDQEAEFAQEDHLHGLPFEQMWVLAANDEHADEQADYIADDVY